VEGRKMEVGLGFHGVELIVLVHGLHGRPADFGILVQSLKRRGICEVFEKPADFLESVGTHHSNDSTRRRCFVHCSTANTHKTHDGIDKGGLRLASEILSIVEQKKLDEPLLDSISMIGFSLGGIYCRYAIAKLYDPQNHTVAGLKPRQFISIASPHLGCRKFGWNRFVPHFLLEIIAKIWIGRTALQLLLLDKEKVECSLSENATERYLRPLLVRMTENDSENHLFFVSALKSFEQRVLYANAQNDFLVPFGTAALIPKVRHLYLHPALSPPSEHQELEPKHDRNGVRIWFEHLFSKADNFNAEKHQHWWKLDFVDEESEDLMDLNISNNPSSELTIPRRKNTEEEIIAFRLRDFTWRLICIDFRMALPFAHNRILAVSRNLFFRWMNWPGERVVEHIADLLISD